MNKVRNGVHNSETHKVRWEWRVGRHDGWQIMIDQHRDCTEALNRGLPW